ncbi:MAG: murein biosynthesis integral membrane protein MurJ [Verrucomicrobiales bacterium]|nr:murein biosynthesis integral membrane protein MurJ [Verrucomicrobiales bacterium]
MFTVGGFTLMSRILGFVRDKLIANLLGAGHLADIWIAAFRLPNLFRRIFGEGAFNSAFVPMYSRKIEEDGEETADHFASRVITLMSLILIALFVICYIFMEPLMALVAWGFEGNKFDLAVAISRITLVYLIFVCLTAALAGVLNSRRVFAAPAFAYLFLNFVFIGGMLVYLPEAFGLSDEPLVEPAPVTEVNGVAITDDQQESGQFAQFSERHREALRVLSWCVVVAGVLQLGIVLFAALRRRVKIRFRVPRIDSDVKRLGLLMTPGLASAGIQQINLLVGQSVASLAEGGNSMIYYADRINQMPLGLIGIAAGIVLLPEITRSLRGKGIDEARTNIAKGVEMTLLLALPAMVATVVIPQQMIYAIFEGGRFSAEDARNAGNALLAFSIGTPAYIVVRVLQTGFFAREDTKTPMRFTMITAGTNIVLCYPLFLWLGPMGCALATSIAGWINVILLWVALKKDDLLRLGSGAVSRILRMLLSAILMGVVVWTAAHFTKPWLMEPGQFVQRLLILIAIVGLGVVAYFGFVFLTRGYSLAEVKGIVRRRGKAAPSSRDDADL